MIPFKKITIKSNAGLVLLNYNHVILDQEIQNNGGCPEAAGPNRKRLLQPRKYQKYPHRSWLGNWLWALIVKIQGYCYLKYREYLQKLYFLDTWCLTEQTNVLKSDTTSNRINHTACYIWPSMLHISCALINSSTLKTSSISTNSWGYMHAHQFTYQIQCRIISLCQKLFRPLANRASGQFRSTYPNQILLGQILDKQATQVP